MKKTIKKTRNAGTLTESQYFSKLRSALRNAFRWWKPLSIALDNSSRAYNGLNKRIKKEYQCNHCKEWYIRKNIEVHHKIECGSLKTYDDIVPFIQKLTTENVSTLEVLCKECHLKETKKLKLSKKNEIK